MTFCVFSFIFRLEPTVRKQLDENNFRHYYGIFFVSTILNLLDSTFQQLRNTLTTAFERHLTVEYFKDMDKHRNKLFLE